MRILFATLPADGHFNPLAGIAAHLRDRGHDVRWYTGRHYAAKLERLGIPHLPFKRAEEIGPDSIAIGAPERSRLNPLAQIRYDLERIFVANVEAYFQDVQEIESSFPFEVLFCDGGFLAATLIREKLGKHVCSVGLGSAFDLSNDAPPPLTGFKPARTPAGRLAYRVIRAGMDWLVMGKGRATYNRILASHGLPPTAGMMFSEGADVLFAGGVPGFVFPARRPNPKARFVGLLRPPSPATGIGFPHPELLSAYDRVVLITQGTVDNRDLTKLIVPALEALKDSGALLIVTTAGVGTEELRRSYPQKNVVIEDFVDYDLVLDHADLYITNGGSGGVLLSLSKGVPVLGAGVREGKNDVNARVDYFQVGIDLHSERPSVAAIRKAAGKLLDDPRWKRNAERIRDEFSTYRPYEIIDAHLAALNGARA